MSFGMKIIVAICLNVIGCVIGFTYDMVDKNWKDMAVKHKAAEYYLDSNHDRQWHWLDEPKKP